MVDADAEFAQMGVSLILLLGLEAEVRLAQLTRQRTDLLKCLMEVLLQGAKELRQVPLDVAEGFVVEGRDPIEDALVVDEFEG